MNGDPMSRSLLWKIEISPLYRMAGFAVGVAVYALIVLVWKRAEMIAGLGDILVNATNPVAGLAGIILGACLSVAICGMCFSVIFECVGIVITYNKRTEANDQL